MGVLFRSVLGQFLPLSAVGIAYGISIAMVFIIGSTVAQIDSSITTMLFAILMGVGTDYSIFVIMRYREESYQGKYAGTGGPHFSILGRRIDHHLRGDRDNRLFRHEPIYLCLRADDGIGYRYIDRYSFVGGTDADPFDPHARR